MCVTQYGALLILGAFVGALGLPVFAVHTWAAWRYFAAVRRSRMVAASGDGGDSPAIEAVTRRGSSIRKSDVRPATRYASTLVRTLPLAAQCFTMCQQDCVASA